MKKVLLILVAVMMVFMITGCGHQVPWTYTEGTVVNFGFDPNTNKLGIQYVDGVFVSAVIKENSEGSLEFDRTQNVDGKIEKVGSVKIWYKAGDTTTGYDVDLAKVKRQAVRQE